MSFTISAHNEYCLRFAYNMNGGYMGELTVQNGEELWTKEGNQGHSWKEAKVTINADTGDFVSFHLSVILKLYFVFWSVFSRLNPCLNKHGGK